MKHRHDAQRLLAQFGLDRNLWRGEHSNSEAMEISEGCDSAKALCRRIYLTRRECYYLQLHMSTALTDMSHLLNTIMSAPVPLLRQISLIGPLLP
jgi:hypothetical protein